ncbi:MAG: FumA C-terminus/TtdB family hydratase beta subunit [Deltaproteobacteria bacterium]|jgi:fumarate hydratase subunit beta|nr:FumA C-terminus/TtdB family hydratase beta subunit [Deltaproteobacteria bacterium]
MDSPFASIPPPPQVLKVPIEDPKALYALEAGQDLLLEGRLVVGRDMAHKRLIELLREERELPFAPRGAVIYYMGPSPAPPGRIIGSAGPTTSGRMDALTIPLLEKGVKALVGKGRRSAPVKEALIQNGAVYLAAVGGAGAYYGDRVKSVKVLAWPELGPEALLELEVSAFPALVVYDLLGGDQYVSGPSRWRLNPQGI